MFPAIGDLLSELRVVALPMRERFRGITVREAALLRGPFGWTEFAPFVEYDDIEASAWLAAAIDFGWQPDVTSLRSRIPVNATVPTVPPSEVAAIIARFAGARTAKVKVADPAEHLGDDVARVAAVRDAVGPEGRIRVDANAGWTLDEAERGLRALAPFDLEYAEQPCASTADLAELRRRTSDLDIPIAADESVRKATDPLAIARSGAADLLVIKAAPLGGVRRAAAIARDAGLPVVVSSAIDTSVGLAMGAYLAASLPELPYDCGLGTAALLAGDITDEPLLPESGSIAVRRVEPSLGALSRYAADADRTDWWRERISRCWAMLERTQLELAEPEQTQDESSTAAG